MSDLTRTPGFASRLGAGLVVLLVVAPIVGLLIALVNPLPDPFGMPQLTFSDVVSQSNASNLLVNSVALATLVSVIAVCLGGWLAWAEQRMRYPFRKALCVASLLPLAIPSYVLAGTAAEALGPGGWLGQPLGLPKFSGFWTAVLVLSVVTTPYVQLLVSAALARGSGSEEEAARCLGAGRWRVFWAVIFPRIRAAVALSGLVVMLYAISDFGAVAVLDCEVLTWRLYQAVQAQSIAEATILGVAVLLATLPLFVIALTLGGGDPASGVANPRPPALWRPGRVVVGLTLLLHGLIIGMGLLLPVITMVGWIVSGWQAGFVFAGQIQPLWDTCVLAMTGAAITGLMAFAPAWIAARDREQVARPVTVLTLMTSALPGVLLAFGLILVALRGSSVLMGDGRLYVMLVGSGALLFVGYLIRFLAEGFASLRTAVSQLDPRQEDSARVLGVSRLRWFGFVAMPTLGPGITVTWVLLFLAIIKELPVTLLLGSATGRTTLAFRVWDRYNEALWHDAGVAGLLLVGLALLVLIGSLRWRRSV